MEGVGEAAAVGAGVLQVLSAIPLGRFGWAVRKVEELRAGKESFRWAALLDLILKHFLPAEKVCMSRTQCIHLDTSGRTGTLITHSLTTHLHSHSHSHTPCPRTDRCKHTHRQSRALYRSYVSLFFHINESTLR